MKRTDKFNSRKGEVSLCLRSSLSPFSSTSSALGMRIFWVLRKVDPGDGDGDYDEASEPLRQSGDTLRNRLAAAVSAPDVRNMIKLHTLKVLPTTLCICSSECSQFYGWGGRGCP